MDDLREQLTTLQERVDATYQLLGELSARLVGSQLVGSQFVGAQSNQRTESHEHMLFSHSGSSNGSSHAQVVSEGYGRLSAIMMDHKDVLLDDAPHYDEGQTGERALGPEIQVQRLTAQLTAAYNRIAALEEQLLSHHVH